MLREGEQSTPEESTPIGFQIPNREPGLCMLFLGLYMYMQIHTCIQ